MKNKLTRIAPFVLAGLVIVYVSYFVREISKHFSEMGRKREKRERMQFVKDSLTVEALKRKLIDSSEYSEDKISNDDLKETVKH